MKRIALMTTVITTAVLMMVGITRADEMTRTTIEASKHVTTTPADPLEAPPAVQERSYQRTEQQSSTITDPTEPSSVQERSHVRTEHQSSTVTSDPVPPPPVQERSSDSYRTEERSFSTADPLDPQEKTTTRSRIEERSSTTVPPPEVQQRTTIERRSSTVTSD
jgi:hypothetical protein